MLSPDRLAGESRSEADLGVGVIVEPLLERDRELGMLGALLTAARGGEGSVALLEGPPGIGKTALLGAARVAAVRDGFQVLSARGGELEREFPFGLARQLFEPALRRLPPRDRAEVLSDAAALSERALGVMESDDGGTGSGSLPALHGLYWLCANLAERGPLLLLVDDAHWADLTSLRWLVYLARRLDGVALLVVVATRIGTSGAVTPLIDELRHGPSTHLLEPEPLSEEGAQGLIAEAFAEAPEPDFVRACQAQCAGNPLLLNELVLSLAADGARPDAQGARRILSLPPQPALRSVLLKLGRLPPAASRLARAIAILETGVAVQDAQALAGLDAAAASEAAATLAAAGILVPDLPLRFVHPLVRAAIYDDIPAVHRAAEHARAARLLRGEPSAGERVTAHLLAAEPCGEEWVGEHLRAAARDALSRGAPETAIALLERCLMERPTSELRSILLRELGTAEARVAPGAAIEHLDEALESTADPRERLAVARLLAGTMALAGRIVDAYELLEQALAQVPDADRELALAAEAELLAVGLNGPSLLDRISARVARLPELSGRSPGERLVLANVARFRTLIEAPSAETVEIAERALAGGRLLFDQTPDSPTYSLVVVALTAVGERPDAVARLAEHAIVDARARGSMAGLAQASAVLCYVELDRGDLRAAEARVEAALELARQSRWLLAIPGAVTVSVLVAIERDRLDAADTVLRENYLDGVIPDTVLFFNNALYARGCLRLAQGRTEDGIADLLELGRRERTTRHDCNTFPWRAAVAPALAATGHAEEGRRLAQDELQSARRRGTARRIGPALRALAAIELGADGVERLREAVRILEATPLTLQHAHALADLGAALRRANERAEARVHLSHALDLAHRCGATVLAEEAHRELLATGARPRKVLLSGLESLTASERRVAELAAKGMSNKQVAQALFVTVKTVETHLHHSYQKLDVASRGQLAVALSAAA